MDAARAAGLASDASGLRGASFATRADSLDVWLFVVALAVFSIAVASILLPALLPNAVVPPAGAPHAGAAPNIASIVMQVGLRLRNLVAGGGGRQNSEGEAARRAIRLAPNGGGFMDNELHPKPAGLWSPASRVDPCTAPGCTRREAQFSPGLCALCALINALTAGGGGGPYGPTNRSSENDVLTVLLVVLLLSGIKGVFVLRDATEAHTDFMIVRGKRVLALDIQSGQDAFATHFLDDALRAASNGYDVLACRAGFWAYNTQDGQQRVARAMGAGPVQVLKAFFRAFLIVTLVVVPFLTDEDGLGWPIINNAILGATALGQNVNISVLRLFVDGCPLTDTEPPILPAAAAAAAGGAAVAAARAAFGAGPSFPNLLSDNLTGQAHFFSSMIYIHACMGTFIPSRLIEFVLHPPAAALPIDANSVALWNDAVDGAWSARFAPFITVPQAGAFHNDALFPRAVRFVGPDYVASRTLAPGDHYVHATPAPPAVAAPALALAFAAPEFWSLAFSRVRFQPPAPVLVHNPVAPAGGGAAVAHLEPSIF